MRKLDHGRNIRLQRFLIALMMITEKLLNLSLTLLTTTASIGRQKNRYTNPGVVWLTKQYRSGQMILGR